MDDICGEQSGDGHKQRRGNHHIDSKKRHKDQHREKNNRHKSPDGGHRCICGYDSCPKLEDYFIGKGHLYDGAPIRFLKYDDPLWPDSEESLIRNLHVTDEKKEAVLPHDLASNKIWQ